MKSQGFTIIEIIVVIAVISLLSIVTIDLYIKSHNMFTVHNSQSQLQIVTKASLDEISDNIKKSSSVLSTYTAPDDTVYQTSNNTLILRIPSLDENQDVIENKFDYIIYEIDSVNLHYLEKIIYADALSIRKNTSTNINQKLDNLNFVYFDSTNAEINVALENTDYVVTTIKSEEVVNGKTNSTEYETKSKLRNK